MTSNLERAKSPGNLLLGKGEANLPKQSVVTSPKYLLSTNSIWWKKIGSLSHFRMEKVLEGIGLLITPRDIKD